MSFSRRLFQVALPHQQILCTALLSASLLGILMPTWFVAATYAQTNVSPTIIDAGTLPTMISKDFELADGAAWDGAGQLYVPDVKGKRLLAFNLRKLDAPPKVLVTGLAISGTAYQQGLLYLADNQGARIATLDVSPVEAAQPTGGKTAEKKRRPKAIAVFDPKERPNDLTVDAMGNIYVTITGKGLIRKITPDGKVSDIATGLVTPNGIAISPAGKILYASSAKSGVIYRIDLNKKGPPEDAAETIAGLPETEDGFRGDGMCTDRAGNLYVTGARSVFVFDPSGNQLGSFTPPERPINAIIAGANEQALFLSTFGGLYSLPINAYGVSPNKPVGGQGNSPTATAIADDIQAHFNLVYHTDGTRELLADVFVPTGDDGPKPAIVVVHGGGWKNGDKTKFRALALRLAERGYVTAAIEYRLAREAAFPAAIRDCNAATVYLKKNAKRFGIDPNRIAAVGGSAGGHLVGLMAAGANHKGLKHDSLVAEDASLQAAAVLAGPLEIASGSVAERSLSSRAQSNSVLWMRGDVNEKADLYHLADAFEKVDKTMPPTLFLCGSLDNPERNARTRKKMDSYGIESKLVIHQDAKHGHWNRPDWIGQVVDDIDAFFKQHL